MQILTGNVEADLQQDTSLFYPTQLGFSLQEKLRVSGADSWRGNVGYDVNAVLHDAVDLR